MEFIMINKFHTPEYNSLETNSKLPVIRRKIYFFFFLTILYTELHFIILYSILKKMCIKRMYEN